jgi:hypothetical protein
MGIDQQFINHDARERARLTDPSTSKEAAAKVTHMRASQARVLAMFKLYGDLHDKQLIEYLHDAEKSAGLKPMSESGARSRRSELSKPNMDRIAQMIEEACVTIGAEAPDEAAPYADLTEQEQRAMRARLLIEGLRSPLWDTGKRVIVDGRKVIVWGLAQ